MLHVLINPMPASPRFSRFFSGASPVLRALAWFSVLCLLTGWSLLFLPRVGLAHPSFAAAYLGSHLAAFIAGLSSFCPLGGLSASLAVLTMAAMLIIGSGGANC